MNIFKSAETAIENLLSDFRLIGDRVQQMAAAADKNNTLVLDVLEEHEQRFKALEGAGSDQPAPAPAPAPEPEPVPEPEQPSGRPELLGALSIASNVHTFRWSLVDGFECNLEIGTTLGGHEIWYQTEVIDGEYQTVRDIPDNVPVIYARLWLHEFARVSHVDYEFKNEAYIKPSADEIDVELPANAFTQWPMNAESADFRTKYSALSGFHLMNQGRDFVKNFRFLFGHDGRQTTVTNQPEFDQARNNGDFGVIFFISDKPVVLIDRRRTHDSVQLLVCDTLSFIRTWGNLAIDCDAVSAPQGGGANVIAHGSNVLYSKAKGAVIEHTWADMTVEPPSPRLIKNVVSQGGARRGHYSAGAERVSFGVSAWTSNWEQHWDDDIQQRDFPLNTEAVGMQGSEDVDAGADTMQPLEMTDWLDPAKSNHPHGVITNSNMFAIGVLAAVTKAKWNPALGEGEQGIDGKAALLFEVLDSLFSGFMVNKVGYNNSWGGGVFSSHFNVNDARVKRCAGSNQHRHIEIGSGDKNLIEECLFADTQAAFDYVTKLGHNAGGQQDIVAYRETRYPWAAHGHTTAVQARNNVYDHTPRHSAVGLTVENEIVTDPRFNVYKDFGDLGLMLIGTTDPKAKGSIWYAG